MEFLMNSFETIWKIAFRSCKKLDNFIWTMIARISHNIMRWCFFILSYVITVSIIFLFFNSVFLSFPVISLNVYIGFTVQTVCNERNFKNETKNALFSEKKSGFIHRRMFGLKYEEIWVWFQAFAVVDIVVVTFLLCYSFVINKTIIYEILCALNSFNIFPFSRPQSLIYGFRTSSHIYEVWTGFPSEKLRVFFLFPFQSHSPSSVGATVSSAKKSEQLKNSFASTHIPGRSLA